MRSTPERRVQAKRHGGDDHGHHEWLTERTDTTRLWIIVPRATVEHALPAYPPIAQRFVDPLVESDVAEFPFCRRARVADVIGQ